MFISCLTYTHTPKDKNKKIHADKDVYFDSNCIEYVARVRIEDEDYYEIHLKSSKVLLVNKHVFKTIRKHVMKDFD